MKKWICSKNIANCSLLVGVMFIMGAVITTLSSVTGKSIIQFSDIVYLILLGRINLFTLVLSALISGILIDLYAGGLIFIPISILVKILIGLTYYLLRKRVNIHLIFIISYSWVFIYNLYSYLLWDASVLIVESIVNAIQYSVTVVMSSIIVLSLELNMFNKNKKFHNNKNNKEEIS
ncbi:hypothetical protein SCORR_v1c03260 [Spiroplasma corruscae]|uniref:Rod shape-determining protein MreD n=1 Tax=Spiroplasma corruscae TaxID=216934 RepID=A0A222ENM7_9MOLU|nr:hypothetical protein [Spiroplasma corruscae]ASP28100.1 hypothetical protein SCORR_v1c03260 [Spiroplasma corruscae]